MSLAAATNEAVPIYPPDASLTTWLSFRRQADIFGCLLQSWMENYILQICLFRSKYVFLSFRTEFQPLCSVNSKKLPTPQPAYNAPSTLAAMLLNTNTRGVCSYSPCASVVVEVKDTRFSSCIHRTFRTAAGLDAMMTRVKSLPLMGTKPRSSSPVLFHNFLSCGSLSAGCVSFPPTPTIHTRCY